MFLPDIADWLQKALAPIKELSSIERGSLFAADQLVALVKALPSEFGDQKQYLLKFEERLKDTGMDQRWQGTSTKRAAFVAGSMAGARWGLTPSSSREMVRLERLKLTGQRLKKIGIVDWYRWWDPDRGEPVVCTPCQNPATGF